jgi:hypothetical protein
LLAFSSWFRNHVIGTIDERERGKVIELRGLASKLGHRVQGGPHEIFGVRGRESRYELLHAVLAISIACAVTRIN